MERQLNPNLEVNDRVVCYYMDGESSFRPGTTGTVIGIIRDPIEPDGKIIKVKWDNGSELPLISVADRWKKIKKENKENIKEAVSDDAIIKTLRDNRDIFDNFDWRFLKGFLMKIRKSGIINMASVSPLLYAGKNHIERYYGEDASDDEAFQEVLDIADKAKDKMIQGVMKYMNSNGIEIDVDSVNSIMPKMAKKMWNVYMNFAFMRYND